jgi:acyl-CoA reductase-like NAD-dependent aldehyde dehydrogenase
MRLNLIEPAARPRPDFLGGNAKGLLIDGAFVAAASGQTFESIDPTTESVLGTFAAGDRPDVDRAVAAARRAFEGPAWRQLSPTERGRILLRIAEQVDAHREELAILESLDNGTPMAHTQWQIASVIEVLEYYAGWPTKLCGVTYPTTPTRLAYGTREPLGVCAGISPWNSPIVNATWKFAPAIACGNTVVLKPAEQTPMTAVRLGELLLETDLPPGVINIVTGFGETAGAALSGHPGVAKVAFTGSTEVGKLILQASVADIKRVTLELGGKSPNIIFADADIPAAAAAALRGFTALTGQACIAGTRIFVERPAMDEFSAALVEAAERLVVGDPFAPNTQCGPLASIEQRDRVQSYLDIGADEGAVPLTGGRMVDGTGYFVETTVLSQVDNQMRIAREEIFGPVAAVIPFDDEDQVLREANDTRYGLAAGVFTSDISRANRISAALDAGTVWVNTYLEVDVNVPFGGFKESGSGKELGPASIESYTRLKSTIVKR